MASVASCSQDIPELRLGHTIFICHSGADKTFGRLLHNELKKRWYDPFLDEVSLPKAKEVSMVNILKEARRCKLALLILTPNFFCATRNPMLEVMVFVENDVEMLPLFYELTVQEVTENRDSYKKKWTELNAQNFFYSPEWPKVDMWDKAFKKITEFNGLRYRNNSTNEADFIDEIVDHVQKILPPNKQRDDTHIVGKERLVKVVDDWFTGSSHIESGIKVLGLHGMEGIGKTTLCSALCNFYLSKFQDRVCHLQLHEGSHRDRINSILLQLASRNDAYSQKTDIEAERHLERTLSESKFFLVIDDIQDSYEADKCEIKSLILKGLKRIPSGSKLLFLARCPSILKNVLSSIPELPNIPIHPFPSLSLDEAKLVLCKEFPYLFPDNGRDDPQQVDFLNQCTTLCTSNSNTYNPLMLKLLASFLVEKCSFVKGHENCIPILRSKLSSLKGDRSWAMKEFFDKLQIGFNALVKDVQDLFIDLALFTPGKDVISKQLCLRREKKAVKESLEKLQHVAFLSEDYGILDVYKELAKMIARQSSDKLYKEGLTLKAADLLQLSKKPWTRVAFVGCEFRKIKLNLSGWADLEVLLLDGNKNLTSVSPPLNSLQSIEIRSNVEIQMWQSASLHDSSWTFRFLAILELGGTETDRWRLDTAKLIHCGEGLEIVHLSNISLWMATWELPSWPCLKELKVSQVADLQVLSGLEKLSILEKLCVYQLEALTSLSDVQPLSKLTTFLLSECSRVSELRLPGSLQHCVIENCGTVGKIDFGGDVAVATDTSKVIEAESSNDERETSDHRIRLKACRSLQEISGLQKRRQPLGQQVLDFRCADWFELGRISLIEFRKSAQLWYLHTFKLNEVRNCKSVCEHLGGGDGLKKLKIVCATSGCCGCKASPPSFHLLSGLESLKYHCSFVTDLSLIRQCSNLQTLCLDGCTNAVEPCNFSDVLSLSKYDPPKRAVP